MFARFDAWLKKWTSALVIFTLLFPTSAPVAEASWWRDWIVPAQDEINNQIPEVRRTNVVAILVEDAIAVSLATKVDRYAADVRDAINAEVIVTPVPRDASPITVFEGLQQLYFSGPKNDNLEQLVGVVLVGDVPVPVVDKNGARWPTIWPYTDFENVSYQWNADRGQFIWQGGDDQPEIWHGWIRSDATSASGRASEIGQYLDRNHNVHEGGETYAKKVFFADLIRQRAGLTDAAKETYQNWIDLAEDVAYLRYTKHLGQSLFDGAGLDEVIPTELQPDEMKEIDSDEIFESAPDVQVKNMIDSLAKRYFEAHEGTLSKWNDRTAAAGRWEPTELDTTISLVSRKDIEALQLLRSFNDALENALFSAVEAAGTAEDISLMNGGTLRKRVCLTGVPPLPETTYGYFPAGKSTCGCIDYTDPDNPVESYPYHVDSCNGLPDVCTCDYFHFPERWNGVPIDENFATEECSLLRGSIADAAHPWAQRVEANKVFSYAEENINTEEGDVCTSANFEHCCGLIQEGADGLGTDQCRAVDVQHLQVQFTNDGEDGYGFRNELQPLFDITATTQITEADPGYDQIGANGCEDLIWEKYPAKYGWAASLGNISPALPPPKSSLVEHVEPTVETIRQQVAAMITKSLPVDDPRGFSLYDANFDFHRIGYPDVFDLRDVGVGLSEEDRAALMQSTLESSLSDKIAEVQALPNGAIPVTTFDPVLSRFDLDQVFDAVMWLDLPLEEKNVRMLVGALMDVPDAQMELLDPAYDGYEVIDIIGQESKLLPRGGVDVAFERGSETPNNTVQNALRAEVMSRWGNRSERSFGDVDFAREVLGDGDGNNAENRSPSCDGKNILVWPLCLVEWLASLPAAFSQFTQIVPQFSDNPDDPAAAGEMTDMRVHGGFEDPAIVDVVTEMKLEPSNLELRASDRTPQKIHVTLVSPNGGPAQSVFEDVTVTGSGDAARFLKIVPETTRETTEGEVEFVLVPQRVPEDADFSLTFSGAGTSATLPVKIRATELDVWAESAQLPVRDPNGTLIEVTVLTPDGEIDHGLDDQNVIFESDWGSFDGAAALVEDGVATVRFFPGAVAGLAEVEAHALDDAIAPAKTFVRLLPDVPDHLIFTGPDALVVDGDPVPVHADLADQWENAIDDQDLQLVWTEQGVTVSEDPDAGTMLAIAEGADDPAVKVSSRLIKKVVQEKFEKVVQPTFKVTLSKDTLEAGSKDVAEVRVQAMKPDGTPLIGQYPVQLVQDAAGIGNWPEEVVLHDGVALFDVRAGTLAGKVTTEIQAPGFVPEPFDIRIEPSDPYRILLETDETTISVKDADDIAVSASVVDQFGNLTPDDPVTVDFRVNPSETFAEDDKDELIDDLDVYESGSEGANYLERRVEEASGTAGTSLLVANPSTLTLTEGKGELTLEPLGIGGHAYVIAEASGLVPAVLEIELTNVLAVSDLKFLNPKSLLTLILGMDGGNLTRPSLGTRFLLDGETQAVGTMLVSPTAPKQVGILTAAGQIDSLEATVAPTPFFEITLENGTPVGQVRANFGTEAHVFWDETDDRGEGVYLRPWVDDVLWRRGTLTRGSEKLLRIMPAGGVQLQRADVTLVSHGGSIWDWEVRQKDELVARLRVVPPERIGVVDEWSITPGVQVQSAHEDVRAEMAPVGVSTGEQFGVLFSSVSDIETDDRLLGARSSSVEDALEKPDVGWTEDWKPATLFAAGNTIGDSVRFHSSDAFVLLGDPTLTVPTENAKNALGITPDIGRPMWVSPRGGIDQVHTGDLNGDGRAEILPRIGDTLYVLFHDAQQRDNFRDTGPLLRFADGVKMTAVVNNKNGDLGAIAQVNSAGELVWHQNKWGELERKTLDLGIDVPLAQVHAGDFNADGVDDLLLVDVNAGVWIAFGRTIAANENMGWDETGLYAPLLLERFAPELDVPVETYSAAAEQNPERRVYHADNFPTLFNAWVGYTGVEIATYDSNSIRKIQERPLIRATDSKNINFSYTATGGDPLTVGAVVQNKLTISQPLPNGQIRLPLLDGMTVDTSTVTCSGCSTDWTTGLGRDDLLVEGSTIGGIITWQSKLEALPPLQVQVVDFTGDGSDDVAVAWMDDETPTFVRFKSGGGGMPYADAGSTGTEDAPVSPITGGMSRDVVPAFPDPIPDDFDPEATADAVFEELKTPGPEGELPVEWQVAGLAAGLSSMGCDGGCGLPIPSVAFLASGASSLYIPPAVVPLPPNPGQPVFWFMTAPPFVGAGVPNPASIFRLYVAPTTTGMVGVSACLGPTTLVLPPFIPGTCFVVIPPISITGFCPSGPVSSDASPAQTGLAVQAFGGGSGPKNAGKFTPRRRTQPPNRQLKAPDIITQWIQAQLREISSMTLPAFTIKTPQFPQKMDSAVTEKMSVFDRMSQSPFVSVVRKPISIPYPQISDTAWEEYSAGVDEWLADFRRWKEDTKQSIRDLASLKEELQTFKSDAQALGDRLDQKIDEVLQSYDALETKLDTLPQTKEELRGQVDDPEQYLQDVETLKNTVQTKRSDLSAYKTQVAQLKDMPTDAWEAVISKAEEEWGNVLDDVQQLATAVKANRDALQSYREEAEKLQKLPQEIEKLAERIVATTDIAGGFWSEWVDENKKVVQEWRQFFQDVAEILQLWNKIPKMFRDFDARCSGCSMTRGSLTNWVLNLALGAVKLPVIPMPQVPDVELDLSDVSIGVEVAIPEITFEGVAFVPPGLPNLPDLTKVSGLFALPTLPEEPMLPPMPDVSMMPTLPEVPPLPTLPSLPTLPGAPMLPGVPSLPTVPMLPEIPPIPLDLTVPELTIPALPVLIAPPEFPNILAPIESLLNILQWVLDLFCLFLGNWMPVAESKLASQIAELTNRQMHIPLDFALAGLSLNVPKPQLPPVKIKMAMDFIPALGALNASIEQLAQTFEMATQQMRSVSSGGTDNIFQSVPGGAPLGVEWEPSESVDVLVAARDQADRSVDQQLVDELEQVIVQRTPRVDEMPPEVVAALTQWSGAADVASVAHSRTKRWLASLDTFIPSDQPSEMPEGATAPDSSQTEQLQTIKPQLWYYSPKSDISELVTEFPVAGRDFGLTPADLDRDGNDELLYWIGDTLYFKRLVDVPVNFRPGNLITAGRFSGNADDDFEASGNALHVPWDSWKEWYAPELWRRTAVIPSGATIEFEPPRWRDVNYFEWTISERPDAVFEFATKAADRVSDSWRRIGFVVRPPVKKYEIRPMTTVIKKVIGKPVLYGSVLDDIHRLQVPDCDESGVEKPYFANETVFVGMAPHSRLVVRTLPLEGQQKETREIDLRAGEETWVDFAEVCMTRGHAQAAEFGPMERLEAVEGGYQAHRMRFELGRNDRVELELFDGTPITIFGGEVFELYVVDDLGDPIEHTTDLKQLNHYALFHARTPDQHSFSRQKMLLDPQLADDVTPPQLVVRPGTKVRAWINEPVAIDASDTFDEQEIKKVWWDFHPETDTDGDGDSANDPDFPQSGDASYQTAQLLNVRLPAQERPVEYSVALNVEDPSGNKSQSVIDVSVEAPRVELSEVALRRGTALGKIEVPRSGVEIGLWRTRDGARAALPNSVQTEESGRFEFKNLGSDAGVELRDKFSGEVVAEILPTGRPVVMSEEINAQPQAATATHPTQIELRDSGNDVVATVSVQADASDPVTIKTEPISSGTVSVVTAADRDTEDAVVWQAFEDGSGRMALVDTKRSETLGILDAYGNFSVEVGSGVVLRLKKAKLETDSLVFEILEDGIRHVLAEFGVPSDTPIGVVGRKF